MVQGLDDYRPELTLTLETRGRRICAGPDRVSRPAPRRLIGLLVAVVLVVSGCGESASPPEQARDESSEIRAFPGSAASLAQLGSEVLQAFATADTTTLDTFRLTEDEHNTIVFPELPAGQPEVNYPVDLAWQNIELRNGRALARQLRRFAGLDLTHLRTDCRGIPQQFETFDVLTDCWVVFQQGSSPAVQIQFFKDVLSRGGGLKVFRYYDEGPRPVD